MGLIRSRQGFSNIGKRLDNREWIISKWNPRYHQAGVLDDTGLPGTGGAHWLLRRGLADAYSWGKATDDLRDWTTPHQDIVIIFNAKMQDAALSPGGTATGHTVSVNGTPQTTTYQSGSGTAIWMLGIPVLLTHDDVLTYSYNPATGNTTSLETGAELTAATNRPLGNRLTRRIRLSLKKSDNAPASNETVQLAVHTYNSGTVEGPGDNGAGLWMRREMEASAITSVAGVLDVPYTGPSACGASVYIVIFRPSATESLAWTDTVK